MPFDDRLDARPPQQDFLMSAAVNYLGPDGRRLVRRRDVMSWIPVSAETSPS